MENFDIKVTESTITFIFRQNQMPGTSHLYSYDEQSMTINIPIKGALPEFPAGMPEIRNTKIELGDYIFFDKKKRYKYKKIKTVEFNLVLANASYESKRIIIIWLEERKEWVAIIYSQVGILEEVDDESYEGPYELNHFWEGKLLSAYGINWQPLKSRVGRYTKPYEFILEIIAHAESNQIKTLYAKNLAIDSLPPEIGGLKALESLILSGNRIKKLPQEIIQLKNLKQLDLRDNQLKMPPEILERIDEPQKILNYYFLIVNKKTGQFKNTSQLNEIKLLFVGQGSVGKTSLVQQILYSKFDSSQNKTEGISIYQWQIGGSQELKIGNQRKFNSQTTNSNSRTSKSDSPIKLNLWDFGGQEIMHATHQFFLTKRSLYLLILDSRLTQEENRVEYWLKIIQSFGGESPVLIVVNKIDQHPLDIDRTGLQKKYPNIVGVLETSAATRTGIEELKLAIAEEVNNLPHVRDLLPETWFKVKKQLEKLGGEQNFITHDKYIELCAANEVSDETSQRTLIGFLHDLGVVLHFQDDPRLEALGILNPQWVTNGVYKILNSHELFQNKGVLALAMLNDILNIEGYPRDKRLFIVDMMKKFELCYDIEADKTFLVPDLLPKDEPDTDGRENALAFQYHYTVLPSSVITRFIVRMNEFAHDTVWRSGVVLKDGGSTALVKADIEDRKVFIWVSGDEHKRHDFLTKIRGQFDTIHKTISKLDVKEMIPVPGHPEAEPVDYDLLLQMDHNNVEVYPVLSGGKMIVVNVRAMLSGVAREADRQRGSVTNFYIGGDMKDSTIISGNENEVNK